MELLVVEDDQVLGKAIQRGLADAGHHCVTELLDASERLALGLSAGIVFWALVAVAIWLGLY